MCQMISNKQPNNLVDALDNLANTATSTQAATIESQQLTFEELTAAYAKPHTIIESLSKKPTTPKLINWNTFNCNGYCWTHGYHLKKNYTSKTCSNQKDGHKEDAAGTNIMGRSQDNKGWDT